MTYEECSCSEKGEFMSGKKKYIQYVLWRIVVYFVSTCALIYPSQKRKIQFITFDTVCKIKIENNINLNTNT